MRLSRLRMRLAAGFALAFAVGLTVCSALGIGYLWRESTRRLDQHLRDVLYAVSAGIEREHGETPDSSLAYVAGEVVGEWPRSGESFLVFDAGGARAAAFGDSADVTRVVRALRDRPARGTTRSATRNITRSVTLGTTSGTSRFSLDDSGEDLRVMTLDTVRAGVVPIRIVSFGSTEGIETDTRLLVAFVAIAAPIVVCISLFAGYLMAASALRPVGELATAISSIAPTSLSTRLPIASHDDELSVVSLEFNALLARLHDAQRRNRQFVREAAHQIRTPLTLVLGEADHALTGAPRAPRAPGEAGSDAMQWQATMARIRRAAEVMRRRVDELFWLAEASAGERIRLDDDVELDGLLLECTDMMRARAAATGHSLAIGEADAVAVRAHALLLREGVLELLENACRHASAERPITVSCRELDRHGEHHAVLEVTSAGRPFALPVHDASERHARSAGRDIRGHDAEADGHVHVDAAGDANDGLGLSIVRWVATSHGGQLTVTHVPGDRYGINRVTLSIPITDAASARP